MPRTRTELYIDGTAMLAGLVRRSGVQNPHCPVQTGGFSGTLLSILSSHSVTQSEANSLVGDRSGR